MEYLATETIIFNDDEFMLMLAAAGIERWYGMGLEAGVKDFDASGRMNECLASLYGKGFIEWNNGRAKMADEIRPAFRVLKNARICITASRAERPELVSGSYCADGMVAVVERGLNRENEVKLTLMSVTDWIESLSEDRYLPHVTEAPAEDEEVCVVTAEIRVPQGKELNPNELVSTFTRHAMPSGRILSEMKLYDRGLYGVFEIEQNDKVMRDVFRTDMVKSILHGWTGGTI